MLFGSGTVCRPHNCYWMNRREKKASCCSCLCMWASNGSKLIDDLTVGRPFWDKELLDSLSLFHNDPVLMESSGSSMWTNPVFF